MPHSPIARLTVVLGRPTGRAAALLACAGALAAAAASPAGAAPVSLSDAREAAGAKVAPLPVEGLRCFRSSGDRGRRPGGRAFCIVNHPVTDGGVCRTIVLVQRRRAAAARARILRSVQCTPSLLQPIQP